jgi:hypothetical protein
MQEINFRLYEKKSKHFGIGHDDKKNIEISLTRPLSSELLAEFVCANYLLGLILVIFWSTILSKRHY